MLFCTSLIVLVGAADQPQSSPRKLQIVNTKVSRFIIIYSIRQADLSIEPLNEATIHDLRVVIPFFYIGRQIESQVTCYRAGDGDICL